MDRSKCREYTKDEIIDKIFKDLDGILDNHTSNGRLKGEFVATQVMDMLDGKQMKYSYLELIAIDERSDIRGELHSLFLESDEKLSKLLTQGVITSMTFDFIKRVKELSAIYDNTPDIRHIELVADILDIVDNGIGGKKFRLDVCSSPEDKMEAIREGENFYSARNLTISGDLAERYREKNKVHVYTKAEMADMLLKHIHYVLDYSNRNRDERNINSNDTISGSFVSHVILGTIDGGSLGLPYMDLMVPTEENRINVELHSIKNHSVEDLKSFVEEGTLTKAKADFLIAVKELEESYDKGEIGTYDDLALRIFGMIDDGFGEHKCVLRAGMEEDEIEDDDIDVFPTDYPVISGRLAERYKELFMDKEKGQSPRKHASIFNMQNALNASLRGEDRVTPKDFGGIKAFFKNLGRTIGGGIKDDK